MVNLVQNNNQIINTAAPNKVAYYSIKAAGAALMAFGTALTLGGAYYTWPKVTHAIIGAFKQAKPEEINALADIVFKTTAAFASVLSEVSKIGGDIGGWLTLGVACVGGAMILAPIGLAYGTPLVPGIGAVAAGAALWEKADSYKEVQ